VRDKTCFLERGADADGSSELVAGKALVDSLVLLHRRVLDVNRTHSRSLPDVDAGYFKWFSVLSPLITASINRHSFTCHTTIMSASV